MKNKYIVLTALSSLSILFGSCQQTDLELPEQVVSQPTTQLVKSDLETLPYVVRIRLTHKEGEKVESMLKVGQIKESLRSMSFLKNIRATHLERVFPYAGKYEERTRREGLHLWYDIILDEDMSVEEARAMQQKAIELLKEAKSQVTSVELVDVGYLPDVKAIEFDKTATSMRSASIAYPANDPLLPMQWHYNNNGSWIRSVAKADINLFEAWKIEFGKSNVIVSVVDTGVDFAHEDIKDNMYINQAELNGVEGQDDDGNGFVDDIYGYNFALNQGKINPGDHGTHVAGTVAARNNNGTGVSGVAGGNGLPNSGVRIMTCQTFDINPNTGRNTSGGFDKAIKYGADNGAVISQNSWGTPGSEYLRPSYKAAIDYFIKYAGCDNNGNQLPNSPMKGGVVIFAAGNDGADYKAVPASYAPVVSVSAMSTDFRVSPYSNRGDWVSIMAPGGDAYEHNGQVLSTLPGNKYGYMQGTSMACPHVSGVAALIVSKFGGQGFTAEELKKRLTTAILPVDINRMNPKYNGRLGAGYIDAAAALGGVMNTTPPSKVIWDKISSLHTGLKLSWRVPINANGEKAFGYDLYWAIEKITPDNISSAMKIKVIDAEAKSGEIVTKMLSGLEADTEYFFAIQPYDRWGNKGKMSYSQGRTLKNRAPIISIPAHDPIRLSGIDTYDLTVSVSDPDDHTWSYELIGETYGVSVERKGDELIFHFRVMAAIGSYQIKLKVVDELGAIQEENIPFEIYHNVAPRLMIPFTKKYIPIGDKEEIQIDLKKHFSDDDDKELMYTVRTIGIHNVDIRIDKGILYLKGVKIGLSGLQIIATDTKGEQVKATMDVEVVKDEIVHLIYPTPVTRTLNIRFASHLRSAQVDVFTPAGGKMLSKQFTLPEGSSVGQLDVRSLPTGTYILQAEAGGKTFRQSFIKR